MTSRLLGDFLRGVCVYFQIHVEPHADNHTIWSGPSRHVQRSPICSRLLANRDRPRRVFSFAALVHLVALSEHGEPCRASACTGYHRLASASTAAPDAEADEGAVS